MMLAPVAGSLANLHFIQKTSETCFQIIVFCYICLCTICMKNYTVVLQIFTGFTTSVLTALKHAITLEYKKTMTETLRDVTAAASALLFITVLKEK